MTSVQITIPSMKGISLTPHKGQTYVLVFGPSGHPSILRKSRGFHNFYELSIYRTQPQWFPLADRLVLNEQLASLGLSKWQARAA